MGTRERLASELRKVAAAASTSNAEKYEASIEEIEKFGLRRFQPDGTIYLYRAKPSNLSLTGYLGRTTIMEFLVMNDALRRAVMRRDGMGEIERIAREAGMRTMYEDGLSKALSGQTTIEELSRVAAPPDENFFTSKNDKPHPITGK